MPTSPDQGATKTASTKPKNVINNLDIHVYITTPSRRIKGRNTDSSPVDVTTPVDWQIGKSLLESNKYILENQIRCDVNFILTSPDGMTKSIGAHSLILTSRSPVFDSMFSERWSVQETPIRIEDICYDPFYEFLR